MADRTYAETLDFLFSHLPIYQRQGPAALKPSLDNIRALCSELGNPQDTYPTLHIAGTNGKGSTCHMLASILQEAGYKVGLHTSPHLIDFRERIKVNGKMCAKEFVVKFVADHRDLFSTLSPSFFEMACAMTFEYFRQEEVDIAVIETGLGGRLDSTNILKPEVAVITHIGLDHQHLLGDTKEQIAGEKAGIIKANTPAVIGEDDPELRSVFADAADRVGAFLEFVAHEEDVPYDLELKGKHQARNARTAIATLKSLAARGFEVSEEHIKRGLNRVVQNTNLLGRWQQLQHAPLVICDISHNEDGIKETLMLLDDREFETLRVVFGAVEDKDLENVLKLMPVQASYYFCQASIPRAMKSSTLSEMGVSLGFQGSDYGSVENAYQTALKDSKDNDLVLVTGSAFVVAEVLEIVSS